MLNLAGSVLPHQQRRTLPEVTDQLYLSEGDTGSKQSAFWVMLSISAVIATAGVMADSTATVIGAMIIAPLSTPIMGMAIAVVEGNGRRLLSSGLFVMFGAVLVILIGAIASVFIPGADDLASNSQISGRTSPSLVDLVAAVATGFAGAVALSRRDVADILPGVAIAISLVPPLAVVGVTLGSGQGEMAFGALVLFLSNVVALVLAGTLVFTAAGYAREAYERKGFPRQRAYIAIGALLVLVMLPLGINTALNVYLTNWRADLLATTQSWLDSAGGGSAVSVDFEQLGDFPQVQAVVTVQVPGDLPDTATLLGALRGQVPDGMGVVVTAESAQTVDVGRVGD